MVLQRGSVIVTDSKLRPSVDLVAGEGGREGGRERERGGEGWRKELGQ